MEFNSQICTTREQSERLLTLGLKKETADMYTTDMSSKGINYIGDWKIGSIQYCDAISFLNSQGLQLEKTAWSIIPAWSLHRLLLLLPREYIYDIDFQRIMQDFVFGAQDMYDEVISCIETLIEAGYFYEEYLEE